MIIKRKKELFTYLILKNANLTMIHSHSNKDVRSQSHHDVSNKKKTIHSYSLHSIIHFQCSPHK